ncbi:DinB family protein [Mucilaginibacter sabulilitoris]|uniref:DinB family protein n=1 Tax=Mucilaginibacter sabulilitoris TaxID=1173583 RepID=A0ABZ0TMM9_9SPHI|nr:DinB family protein [Mucilaginibacter sabulilitoris]WPU94333.1 DinB family protein [Mucilaginibacter sabulilitoris]
METKTASRRTEGLLTLFDMQTTFFARAIEGISAEDTYNRLNTKANHIAWLTGSLVQQRYNMTTETRPELKQTGDELFKDNKGIQDDAKYPTSAEYLKDWEKISPVAREVLLNMDDEKLDSEIDMGFMKMTYYELLSFTIYREASIIGQLALWRRLLNYPALRYD